MRKNSLVEGKEVISFRKKIGPGASDWIAERVKAEGTIEGLRVRFYKGQVGLLRIRPVVEHKGGKIEDLVGYASSSEQFLYGDDDYFVFDVTIPVSNDDYVKIKAENLSSYEYDVVVDVIIDYYGGRNRIIGGVI